MQNLSHEDPPEPTRPAVWPFKSYPGKAATPLPCVRRWPGLSADCHENPIQPLTSDSTMKNPIQPLVKDTQGVVRFKANALVNALLEHGQATGLGLNELAHKFCGAEHDDDRQQLAQLIGYSLRGYSELSYVSDDAYGAAAAMADEGLSEKDARIAHLEHELFMVRSALREPIARLFGVHPDDLNVVQP